MTRAQTTALQIERFSRASMVNKPVSEVPGVGPKLMEALVAIGVAQTTDLYNKLKEYGFDETKFGVWMKLKVSKRARVSTIYQALEAWDKQFGGGRRQGDDEAESERTESVPARAAGRSRGACTGGLRATPAAKKRRSSVQYNLSQCEETVTPRSSHQTELSNTPLEDDRSHPSYPLMQFIASLSTVIKKIPEEFHSEFRRDMLNLAEKFENKKSRERIYEPQPSTSSNN